MVVGSAEDQHPGDRGRGRLRIRPLRPQLRGAIGGDGELGGTVADLWVDRSEPQLRYLEVTVTTPSGERRVLVPATMVRVDSLRRHVSVRSVFGSHFADAPTLRNPDEVTRLEEDRICAYFAGGSLYAHPLRQEPLL